MIYKSSDTKNRTDPNNTFKLVSAADPNLILYFFVCNRKCNVVQQVVRLFGVEGISKLR